MSDSQPPRPLHSFSQKNNKPYGRIMRGSAASQLNQSFNNRSVAMQRQIMKQLEFLPKLKNSRKRATKSLLEPNKNIEQIIIMQSGVFPSIYYKKANLRTVLKQFNFPQNVKGLPPKDERIGLIYQIVLNLFNEITFFAFNILVGESNISGSIFVFFSDAETIPYSKCCNLPVYIQLCQNGSGRVLCNSVSCQSNVLAQFLISFEDGKKLWKHLRYFTTASCLDRKLRSRISKLINSGKHRRMNLVSVIHDTSRQIAELLENPPKQKEYHEEQQQEQGTSPFLTYANNNFARQKTDSQPIFEGNIAQVDENQIFSRDLIQQLPQKFMSKTYSQFQSKVSQGIVNQGKVFQKDFELIKRIDEQLLDKKRTKNSTAINFPRLMSQFHRDKKRMRKVDQQLQQIKNIVNNSIL